MPGGGRSSVSGGAGIVQSNLDGWAAGGSFLAGGPCR
jgi:hypothetical protein